jgi:ankyrin repeat protein
VFANESNDREESGIAHDVCYWASSGNELELKKLLKSGVDINWTDGEGRTALHWVCDRGHKDLFSYITTLKVDVNIQDEEGYTPLH